MDALFSQIETWNNNQEWGSVLDAGSGPHSLSWLLSLDTDSVTALTGDPQTKAQLTKQFSTRLRETDAIHCGNWLNQSLFEGRVFDTVIMDYLIGSMSKYSPYFQSQIFQRIRNQSKTKLYVSENIMNIFNLELKKQINEIKNFAKITDILIDENLGYNNFYIE